MELRVVELASGYLECDGRIIKINSIEQFKQIIEENDNTPTTI